MRTQRSINLQFPLAGLDERGAYQNQPPYSTPAAWNVRPREPIEGRSRGGSRPGLVRAFALRLGTEGSRPIRLSDYIIYEVDNVQKIRFVAIAGGLFYHENPEGTLILVEVDGEIGPFTTTRAIHATQRGQKLYIADSTGTPSGRIYDPVAGTVSAWVADEGTLPDGCPLISLYRDRIVLASGNDWFMSRQGNPAQWDFADDPNDSTRAVSGATSPQAGIIGDPITAIIPYTDDYFIFACEANMWVLRGDPALGGQIDNLSRTVGMVDQKAWCHGPRGEIFFLDRGGLYVLPAGATASPELLSEQLPTRMQDIEKATYTVLLGYDDRRKGILIWIVHNTSVSPIHFWYDLPNKSFWPMEVPGAFEPMSLCMYHATTATRNAVMFGGYDGYVRKFSDAAVDDDGTDISSYVFIGPFRLGDSDSEGILEAISGVVAEDGGNVTWSIMIGDSAESVVSAAASATGEWVPGTNYVSRPRVRGVSCIVKLSNGTDAAPWGIESIQARLRKIGPVRKF